MSAPGKADRNKGQQVVVTGQGKPAGITRKVVIAAAPKHVSIGGFHGESDNSDIENSELGQAQHQQTGAFSSSHEEAARPAIFIPGSEAPSPQSSTIPKIESDDNNGPESSELRMLQQSQATLAQAQAQARVSIMTTAAAAAGFPVVAADLNVAGLPPYAPSRSSSFGLTHPGAEVRPATDSKLEPMLTSGEYHEITDQKIGHEPSRSSGFHSRVAGANSSQQENSQQSSHHSGEGDEGDPERSDEENEDQNDANANNQAQQPVVNNNAGQSGPPAAGAGMCGSFWAQCPSCDQIKASIASKCQDLQVAVSSCWNRRRP